jgi:hypothetical protein
MLNKHSTHIYYFLIHISNTKVERGTNYEILVLYNLNFLNLKLFFGLRTGKSVKNITVGLNGHRWFAMNFFASYEEKQ